MTKDLNEYGMPLNATAKFINFSNEPFTGFWGGRGRTFQPGQEMILPEFLARHYAKHLTNRELLKIGAENYTSPKVPTATDQFMTFFKKAYIVIPDLDDGDNLDAEIAMLNQPGGNQPSMNINVIKNKPAQAPAPRQRPASSTAPAAASDAGSQSGAPLELAPIGEDDEESQYNTAPGNTPAAPPKQ